MAKEADLAVYHTYEAHPHRVVVSSGPGVVVVAEEARDLAFFNLSPCRRVCENEIGFDVPLRSRLCSRGRHWNLEELTCLTLGNDQGDIVVLFALAELPDLLDDRRQQRF